MHDYTEAGFLWGIYVASTQGFTLILTFVQTTSEQDSLTDDALVASRPLTNANT